MLSKDNDKNRVMHSKSDNIEIIIDKETNIDISRYQIRLEESLKVSVFDCVD